MINNLPVIILTGASGFIGKYFLNNVKNEFYIFAIARRSSMEANVPIHSNIQWVQWDIANSIFIEELVNYIQEQGGADFMIHLAGYYDFDYKDKPEYYRTNIVGTKNVLKLAQKLRIKRFIFASSLAACNFPHSGNQITEKTPPNADFAYARSKKEGEVLVKQYSKYFSCSIIRFAAVFSDWCEYAPLYKFLSVWLSSNWMSRILAGNGNSAITYIHVHDLKNLFITILRKTRFLPDFDTYIASPDGCTSHSELFYNATMDFFGRAEKPVFIHKYFACFGIMMKNFFWKIGIISEPFEKLWMIRYIDKKLNVDASFTRKVTGWKPTARYHILRRMLFMLVNLKSHPIEWKVINEAALEHLTHRSNLIIYEKLLSNKEKLLSLIIEHINKADNKDKFLHFRSLKPKILKSYINTIYNLLLATVRSGDRSLMIKYIDDISFEYFSAGFEAEEVNELLKITNYLMVSALFKEELMEKMKQQIHDYVTLAFQLAQDEIEDTFEEYERKFPKRKIIKLAETPEVEERNKLILKLSKPYQVYTGEDKKSDKEEKAGKFSLYDMK